LKWTTTMMRKYKVCTKLFGKTSLLQCKLFIETSVELINFANGKPNRHYSKFTHNNKIFISFYANAHLWVIALLDFQYLYYTKHSIQYSSSNQVIHITKREDTKYYVVLRHGVYSCHEIN